MPNLTRFVRSLALGFACSLLASAAIAQDPMGECIVEAAKTERFIQIRPKMSLTGSKDQTFAMLVDRTYVTDDERKLISDWMAERENCWRKSKLWQEAYLPPELRLINDRTYSTGTRLVAELYVGNLTYGDYAAKRSEMAAEQARQLNETVELIRAGNKAEAERREYARQESAREHQSRLDAMVQNMQQQKPYQVPFFMKGPALSLPQTRTTTCDTTLGGQVICRTQ